MLIYAAAFVILLTFIPIWKWVYIKDISIWVLFAGVPACYKAIGKNINEHYFHDMFFDNIKFIVLVEFVISTFTFNIVAELFIIPTIAFLATLDTLAERKPEFSSVKKLTSTLLTFAGLAVITFAVREAVHTYKMLGTIDLLVSFAIPFIFSAIYVPIAYAFAMYAKYEILFVRMSFKSSNDKKVRRRQKLAVFKACGLSYKRVTRFEKDYVQNMYVSMELVEFDNLIKIFRSDVKDKKIV